MMEFAAEESDDLLVGLSPDRIGPPSVIPSEGIDDPQL